MTYMTEAGARSAPASVVKGDQSRLFVGFVRGTVGALEHVDAVAWHALLCTLDNRPSGNGIDDCRFFVAHMVLFSCSNFHSPVTPRAGLPEMEPDRDMASGVYAASRPAVAKLLSQSSN
jgi:hypothetical protein